LGVGLAILLTKAKPKEDILLNGVDPFNSGAVVQNPIHEPDTQVYTSKIFDNVGDKDL